MRVIRRIFCTSIVVGILTSCEERFDIDRPGARNDLVINGSIDQGPGPYPIEIEEVINGDGETRGISSACVMIEDENNNLEDCLEVDDGLYLCSGNIVQGTPGMSYRLIIERENGERYESEFDRMPNFSAKLELTWEEKDLVTTSLNGVDTKNAAIFFSTKAQIPENVPDLRLYWKVYEQFQFLQKRTFCIGCPPPPCYRDSFISNSMIHLFSNEAYDGTEYLIDELAVRTIDDTFLRKHVFSGIQQSISEPHYQYLLQLEDLIENIGTLFDTPKGLPIGNIRSMSEPDKRVFGYFSAVLRDSVNIAIYPADLKARVVDQCLIRRDPYCFECESLGGTFERPNLFDRVN